MDNVKYDTIKLWIIFGPVCVEIEIPWEATLIMGWLNKFAGMGLIPWLLFWGAFVVALGKVCGLMVTFFFLTFNIIILIVSFCLLKVGGIKK